MKLKVSLLGWTALLLCSLSVSLTFSEGQSQLVKREEKINYEDYDYDAEDYEDDEEGGGGMLGEIGGELMTMGKEALGDMLQGCNNLDQVAKNAKIALDKLGKTIAKLGGAFKAVGVLVNALSIFIKDNEPESPELKFMKEQFAEVNSKLDVVTSRIGDIENQIEYQGAKVSFGTYNRKIKSLFRDLQYVIDSPNELRRKQNRDYFMENFGNTYDDAAMVLYDGMMGQETDYFGYDLLEVTTTKVRCNVEKIAQMCTLTSKTLANAMSIEGAYFGFRNMTWRLNEEGKKWKKRMIKLGHRCQQRTKKCATEWKKYAEPLITNTYNAKHGQSNGDLVKSMFNVLAENLPQRAWAVWVYDDSWGFGPHTIRNSKSNTWMFWHKFGKCVTVVSEDIRRPNINVKNAKKVFEQAKADLKDCSKAPGGDPAKRIISRVNTRFGRWPGGAMYALQDDIHAEYKMTKNRFVVGNMETNACGNSYHHLVFLFH